MKTFAIKFNRSLEANYDSYVEESFTDGTYHTTRDPERAKKWEKAVAERVASRLPTARKTTVIELP